MRNRFRYFKTSPDIPRLAVMMYIRFPLSLRQVEDLLHERGLDINYETGLAAMEVASGRCFRADQRQNLLPLASS